METSNKSKNEIISECLKMYLNTDVNIDPLTGFQEEPTEERWEALQELSDLAYKYESLALQEAAEKEGDRIASLGSYAKRAFLADLVLEAVNAHELTPVMEVVGTRLNRIDFVEMSKGFTAMTGKIWQDYRRDVDQDEGGSDSVLSSLLFEYDIETN